MEPPRKRARLIEPAGKKVCPIEKRLSSSADRVWELLDLFRAICHFLAVDTILNLEEVCRLFRQQCARLRADRYFSKRICSSLGVLGISPEFIDCLMADKAVISGSLMLGLLMHGPQVFKKDPWRDVDMDIFVRDPVRGDHRGQTAEYLWQSVEHRVRDPLTNQFDRRRLHGVYNNPTSDGYLISKLKDTWTYHDAQLTKSSSSCRSWKVQICVLPSAEPSIASFIDADFDLDFCKIVFDGRNLSILRKKAVASRSSNYLMNSAISDDGGFWVFENHMKAAMNQYQTRCRKYEERGFQILGYTYESFPDGQIKVLPEMPSDCRSYPSDFETSERLRINHLRSLVGLSPVS